MPQAYKVQTGNAIDYTPNAAKSAGDVVVQNGLVGVVPTDLAADELGAVETFGVWSFVKATGAVNVGNAVYWDEDGDPVNGTAGTGAITTTSAGNHFVGYATESVLSGAERVKVLAMKTPSLTAYQPISYVIADPGNGEAIPVTNSGRVAIVTAGSETRTLAAPTFAGQELLLYVKTDGGTCVITCATTVNQTGNNTITMAEVNDSIRLHAIESGSDLRWRVVCNDGAALSTV